MSFARIVADSVIIKVDGVIVESGNAQEILDAPKTARAKAFLSSHLKTRE